MNRFFNPVEVFYGDNSLDNIKDILKRLKSKNVLIIVYSELFLNSENYKNILSSISDYNVKSIVYNVSNPDIEDLYNLSCDKSFDFDIVIGIGGGSVLDISKTLCIFKDSKYDSIDDFRKVVMEKTYKKLNITSNFIGIPTTTGTGSEVTHWATIWDKKKNKKLSIDDVRLYAKAAIVDPKMTITLPYRSVIITGLDAICHATESYWAKSTSEIPKMYALKAIKKIFTALIEFSKDTSKVYLIKTIAEGSMLAGMAFSNTRSTSCHSISYPLSLNYNVPHGIAACITLGDIIEYNKEYIEGFEELLNAFNCKNGQDIKDIIFATLERVDLKHNLKEYGMQKEDIENIVSQCYTKGRMDNNPVIIKEEDLEVILDSLL